MKKITFLFVALFGASASAADVAAVWGKPDMTLEFVQNAVQDHRDIYVGLPESRHTTDFARGLVRGGAKSIKSFGVVSYSGSATYEDFAIGLRRAARHSRIVVTTLLPIRGNAICDVIRDFEQEVVFVFQSDRANENCFSRNILPVIPRAGLYSSTALAAGDLSNYASLHPELSGFWLVEAFRREQGRLANAEFQLAEPLATK